MTAPDDLIRRGDVERIVSEAVVSRPLHDSPATADRPAWAVRNEIAAALRALPADRVVEAAWRLADAVKPPRKSSMVNGYSWCAICQRAVSEESVPPRLHATGCEWVAYRAAVAARLSHGGKDRKATGELSVAPAPATACHNDKPGDPCPCGANFTRCPPEGTPPDGVEIVGGKIVCARCGGIGEIRVPVPEDQEDYFTYPCFACKGRGCVPRVYLGTGTVGEDDCPACGGKP